MLKNVTVGQIALILTGVIGVIISAAFFILYLSDESFDISLTLLLSILIGSVVLCYIVIKFFLDFFVFKKIKLIYKMIDEGKKGKALKGSGIIENKSISLVNDEVIEWAQNREDEIKYLTNLEDYRRNFVGNISHELKTPIFSLQGYIHTLIEGGLYDEAINIKYLNRAAKNIDRLEAIVEDLEEIDELQSGKVSLKIEVFDVANLVKGIYEDLAFMAEDEEIDLMFHPDAKQHFKVKGDKEKIQQVIVNLVANAIKYGKKGGKVIAGFYDIDDKVLIEIDDDGPGVEEKHLKHLFDRFYRVDEGRARKHGGSGLGLSIVKHIIEAHRQTITVKSQEGEGTTFSFTLDKSK